MFFFHKTEVQTVILRCLTGPNLYWLKIYGLRCRWRPWACLVNFQTIASDKWPSYYHIWPFFHQLYAIFPKTEVQTVVLRCLMCLTLIWSKNYPTKLKNAKNAIEFFCTKLQKTGNGNICILPHNL